MALPFISESKIDEALAWLEEHSDEANVFWNTCLEHHPAVEAYLDQEDFILLTPEETTFLVFLLTVVFKSVGPIPPIEAEQLLATENQNWDETLDKLSLEARMDYYFKDYPQEDLLAFAEDSIFDPDNDFLSKEGRLPLFVVVKTILDAITASA